MTFGKLGYSWAITYFGYWVFWMGRGHLGDVYDFMRFYSISLIDFSLSMISPFLDKRLTAD